MKIWLALGALMFSSATFAQTPGVNVQYGNSDKEKSYYSKSGWAVGYDVFTGINLHLTGSRAIRSFVSIKGTQRQNGRLCYIEATINTPDLGNYYRVKISAQKKDGEFTDATIKVPLEELISYTPRTSPSSGDTYYTYSFTAEKVEYNITTVFQGGSPPDYSLILTVYGDQFQFLECKFKR